MTKNRAQVAHIAPKSSPKPTFHNEARIEKRHEAHDKPLAYTAHQRREQAAKKQGHKAQNIQQQHQCRWTQTQQWDQQTMVERNWWQHRETLEASLRTERAPTTQNNFDEDHHTSNSAEGHPQTIAKLGIQGKTNLQFPSEWHHSKDCRALDSLESIHLLWKIIWKKYKSQTSPTKDYSQRIQIKIRYFIMIQINAALILGHNLKYCQNAKQCISNGMVIACKVSLCHRNLFWRCLPHQTSF